MRVERRLTIDELADRLGLSRSTIYHWVRDLPIPGSGPGGGWPADAQRKGNRAMQRKYRLLREDLEGLRGFWAGRLGLDPEAIRMQRKSNSNQLTRRTWRSRHGVLQICVDDTRFRSRLQAWMDCLRAEWL